MEKCNDSELSKYKGIYRQLGYHVNSNHISINPEIDDETLKTIIANL